MKDIRAWCEVDFEVQRVGLTLGQAVGMGVPENFAPPGQYQWEALTDGQAARLIRPVTDRGDMGAWHAVELEEEVAADRVKELIRRELLGGANAPVG